MGSDAKPGRTSGGWPDGRETGVGGCQGEASYAAPTKVLSSLSAGHTGSCEEMGMVGAEEVGRETQSWAGPRGGALFR